MYAIFDPTQMHKPPDRTKDLISMKHRHCPQKLDRFLYSGCNTYWKCFKRSVWCFPDKPFLGSRELKDGKFGDYKWKTFSQVDYGVEALSKAIVTKKLCPLIQSNVDGTPDLKFMAIFSENREEWIMTQLACCSDSICIVPIAI